MLYVYLEDWSGMRFMVEGKGLPHGAHLVKAFATESDPRTALDMPHLYTSEVSDDPFGQDDVFDYTPVGDRFTGPELEARIAAYGLDDVQSNLAARTIRALHRFSHSEGFTAAGMFDHNGSSLTPHPLEVVDKVDDAVRDPVRILDMHLDLFLPRTIGRIKGMVSLDPEAGQVASFRQGGKWRRSMQTELRQTLSNR